MGIFWLVLGIIAIVHGDLSVVSTPDGILQGNLHANYREFLGIPFAQPPVGNLRWSRPQKASSWSGVRSAQKYQADCLQTNGDYSFTSEDCLYLNVFTPVPLAAKPYPVMFWIYGGSWQSGGSHFPSYYGAYILEHNPDVIVVTINYRLGILGYLASEALKNEDPGNSTGNYGLLDQRLAMQWVQDSIAAFGGDPTQVTVFGESAGSASIADHLIMPKSANLFARAVMESGPIVGWAAKTLTVAYEEFANVQSQFKCNSGDVMSCLRSINGSDLIQYTPTTCKKSLGVCWSPVVDYAEIPDEPSSLARAGKFSGEYDVMVGINHDEGTLFTSSFRQISALEYDVMLWEEFGASAGKILTLYPPSNYPTPWNAFVDLYTDVYFLCPARRTARWLSAAGNTVFKYYYTHLISEIQQSSYAWAGVYHSSEIPFVFHVPNGTYSVHNINVDWTTEEFQLQDQVGNYWTQFAVAGNPNGNNQVNWPAFTMNNQQYLNVNVNSQAGQNLRSKYCDLWDSLPF